MPRQAGAAFDVSALERAPARGRPARARLASHTVPVSTPEQSARNVMNPWILLKVKALGELVPGAGIDLERMVDEGRPPRRIALHLLSEHGVRMSALEVARYGSWLPEIRRDALRKAERRSERMAQAARQSMKERRV